jgi:hypothetical protein
MKRKIIQTLREETLKDVPSDRVGEVVQSYITNDGAKEVRADKNAAEKFDVKARIYD